MATRGNIRAHYRSQRLDAPRGVETQVLSIKDAGRRRLENALSGNSHVPLPDALQPFHLASAKERARRTRRVLCGAWVIWARGGWTLIDAVREAAEGTAVGEYALQAMRRCLLELNLDAWERHPFRVRADVRALFRRTIGRLTPHRGGWRVGPPSPRTPRAA